MTKNPRIYHWQLSKSQSLTLFAPVVLIPFSIPLLHHNVPQQKQPTEWLDSLFSRLFTWIKTVIDVEGGMAPYMWYLVERPGGAFNFFPSHKSSHRCH